jgi:ABC-type phosphate/phosphonate transport system ATPase subunit
MTVSSQAGGHLAVALLGPSSSGKSTLLGQLMLKVGHLDGATLKLVEAEAAIRGKRSARLAMVRHRTCNIGLLGQLREVRCMWHAAAGQRDGSWS